MSGLILIPLLAAMVGLMILPQRRQMKEQKALLAALEEGDAVLTTAGIYGIVTELEDDVMFLEVADGIELKMSRAAVARRILDTSEAPAEDAK